MLTPALNVHNGRETSMTTVNEPKHQVPYLFDDPDQTARKPSLSFANQRDEKPSAERVVYVEFSEDDKRNPVNFSKRRKWIFTLTAIFAAVVGATTAATFSPGITQMVEELNCSRFQALVALGIFPLGFGTFPLVTASLSEDFGRQPLYLWSGIGLSLMLVMTALSKNITTVIVGRFLQGAFASPGATMVGGTIADLWLPHERGLPMSIFVIVGVGCNGLGPVYAGWVVMNPRLGWRWGLWIQLIICGTYVALLLLGLRETRASVLLTQLAQTMRKETGDQRYRSRSEDEGETLMQKIYISCARPVRLLFTEAVVISMSLWIGFAWGIVFCMLASISRVFTTLHGFNTGETGTVYITLSIGTILGFITNLYQENLYQKYYLQKGPEARLHTACFAAFLLPIGMLIYAWTSDSHVHWIAQTIGLVIFMWGTFLIYLATFSYLTDCYGMYASSALAAQGLFRNVTATVFPFFTDQMFDSLGYKWGNTLFALLGVMMIPIPFALYFYGPSIRRRSKFSRMVLETQSQGLK